jgi:hypothetical protein
MAVFGRRTARQRLRKATEQALSVPTFRTPDDCTPWVLGGLWPAELNRVTPETEALGEYLKRDLQRIADSANHKLRVIGEAGMPEPMRQAEQNRVVDVARAFAELRVESTVRQLRGQAPAPELLPGVAAADEPTQVFPRLPAALPGPPGGAAGEVAEVTAVAVEPIPETRQPEESAEQRLRRMVDSLARQEPGLRWAVGARADGATVVVTDLAHGWIPPGVDLPAGVEVLPPARRSGNLRSLLGPTELSATYVPGDPFGLGANTFAEMTRGGRAAPEVPDLGWQLAEATRWRDGLARITHTLARAAAAGTGVVEAELDVLRVHLDTARYQLVARYPEIDPAVLLNCLLLAATTALATGDRETANYHFSWFQAFTSATPAQHPQ